MFVKCPLCENELEVDVDLSEGQIVECDVCGKTFEFDAAYKINSRENYTVKTAMCPHCRKKYYIGSKKIGKYVVCAECGKGFVVRKRPIGIGGVDNKTESKKLHSEKRKKGCGCVVCLGLLIGIFAIWRFTGWNMLRDVVTRIDESVLQRNTESARAKLDSRYESKTAVERGTMAERQDVRQCECDTAFEPLDDKVVEKDTAVPKFDRKRLNELESKMAELLRQQNSIDHTLSNCKLILSPDSINSDTPDPAGVIRRMMRNQIISEQYNKCSKERWADASISFEIKLLRIDAQYPKVILDFSKLWSISNSYVKQIRSQDSKRKILLKGDRQRETVSLSISRLKKEMELKMNEERTAVYQQYRKLNEKRVAAFRSLINEIRDEAISVIGRHLKKEIKDLEESIADLRNEAAPLKAEESRINRLEELARQKKAEEERKIKAERAFIKWQRQLLDDLKSLGLIRSSKGFIVGMIGHKLGSGAGEILRAGLECNRARYYDTFEGELRQPISVFKKIELCYWSRKELDMSAYYRYCGGGSITENYSHVTDVLSERRRGAGLNLQSIVLKARFENGCSQEGVRRIGCIMRDALEQVHGIKLQLLPADNQSGVFYVSYCDYQGLNGVIGAPEIYLSLFGSVANGYGMTLCLRHTPIYNSSIMD